MADEHKAPWDCVLAKDDEGSCRPGERPASEQAYFEILCLCLLQAGLNWSSIRKHWPKYKRGFHNFDPDRLAEAEPAALLASPDVIRNGRKIDAVIHNAKEFRAITREHGSFASFLESLRPLAGPEQLKALARRFKHVGPETADYFLHSVGHLN